MSLFVKVVDNEVTQVWDTQPPEGEAGWKSAVEVRPDITDGKQIYTAHTFDLTADPVQIVEAKDAKDQNIAAINACSTHADLDGL